MINNKKVLAIIPARKKSKRILNKNIKLLRGNPLIFYTIAQAKKSRIIDRIIVSTDSEEIAEISKKYGAEAPFLRPARLAQDSTPDFPVFLHALKWLKNNENYMPDIVVHLRPTSPLRNAKQIDKAIKLLATNKKIDSVRSVTEQKHSPYKMYKIDNNLLKPILNLNKKKEFFNLPSQQLPKAYRHIGYVDVIRTKVILQHKQLSGKKIMPLIIGGAISGLDTIEDWEYYEYLMRRELYDN